MCVCVRTLVCVRACVRLSVKSHVEFISQQHAVFLILFLSSLSFCLWFAGYFLSIKQKYFSVQKWLGFVAFMQDFLYTRIHICSEISCTCINANSFQCLQQGNENKDLINKIEKQNVHIELTYCIIE